MGLNRVFIGDGPYMLKTGVVVEKTKSVRHITKTETVHRPAFRVKLDGIVGELVIPADNLIFRFEMATVGMDPRILNVFEQNDPSDGDSGGGSRSEGKQDAE